MTTAKLVIVRHGETEDNRRSLLTGQRDVPLTKDGEEQARAAAMLLGDIRFDKVYSSPLSRAFNTATLLTRAPVEKQSALAEMDFGGFTGCNTKTDAALAAYIKTAHTYETPFPGGESEKQVVARVQEFYDLAVMPRLLRGENVLIVAHEGVMRAFDIILGKDSVPASGAAAKDKAVGNAAPVAHEFEDGLLKKSYIISKPKNNSQGLTP